MSVRPDRFVKSSRQSIVGLSSRVRLTARRLITVAAVSACILLGGCGGYETTWSATSPSPDGRWLAVADTVQTSGFGANTVQTTVEIRETKRRFIFKTSEMVLGISNDGGSMGLKMRWLTPTHLEVEFRADPGLLYYRVVKTSGIEISVRNLQSGEPDPVSSTSH